MILMRKRGSSCLRFIVSVVSKFLRKAGDVTMQLSFNFVMHLLRADTDRDILLVIVMSCLMNGSCSPDKK